MTPAPLGPLVDLPLRCPRCRGAAWLASGTLTCAGCSLATDEPLVGVLDYAVTDGEASAVWDREAQSDPVRSATARDSDGPEGDIFVKMPSYLAELGAARKTYVDVGCGYGRTLLWVMRTQGPRAAVGIDISEVMLRKCRSHALRLGLAPVLLRGDLRDLPLEEASVDVVNSTAVLQHLDKSAMRGIFAEVKRVLRPGGLAYLGGCFNNPWTAMGLQTWLSTMVVRRRRQVTWVRQYTRGQVEELCRSSGFSRYEVRAANYLVLPKNLGRLPVPARARVNTFNAHLSSRWTRRPPARIFQFFFAQTFDVALWR